MYILIVQCAFIPEAHLGEIKYLRITQPYIKSKNGTCLEKINEQMSAIKEKKFKPRLNILQNEHVQHVFT